MPLLITWKCVPLVDLLNALLWAGQNGLPPTPDTLHLGCSYHLYSSHRFLSTWGVVMLQKKRLWFTLAQPGKEGVDPPLKQMQLSSNMQEKRL